MLKRPMLAGKFDSNVNKPPFAVQPKIDGIRCLVHDGVGLSRTLKPIPNFFIQSFFQEHKEWLEGFDGELTVGDPRDPKVFSNTGIMAREGKPNFIFNVFDRWNSQGVSFEHRNYYLERDLNNTVSPYVQLVQTVGIVDMIQLDQQERLFVEQGYEGAIIRAWHGDYKPNRSTTKEGLLLKLKRFVDDEATILGFEELFSNQNEAKTSRLGLTERSSHQANKIAMDTLGALVVQNTKGQEVRVGTGFDQALRKEIWTHQSDWLGKTVKYKFFATGGYELPRHPVYLGLRHKDDTGEAK